MRYLEMLKSAEFRDDLDVVSTIHTPKGHCTLCYKGRGKLMEENQIKLPIYIHIYIYDSLL